MQRQVPTIQKLLKNWKFRRCDSLTEPSTFLLGCRGYFPPSTLCRKRWKCLTFIFLFECWTFYQSRWYRKLWKFRRCASVTEPLTDCFHQSSSPKNDVRQQVPAREVECPAVPWSTTDRAARTSFFILTRPEALPGLSFGKCVGSSLKKERAS